MARNHSAGGFGRVEDDTSIDAERLGILAGMRAAFSAGECETVLGGFERLGEAKAIRSGIRVEAICLVARAKIAQGAKAEARQLLKQVWSPTPKSHRLCRYVAITCLELGEYRRAAALCERAADLAEAGREAAS